MARGQSVIVGGGIAAGSPFSLGSLTRIIDTDPPTIADSIVFQRTQTVEVITVGNQLGTDWPLPATVTEKLQVVGGFVSDTGATGGAAQDNVLVGRGASAAAVANARNVVIGTEAAADAATSGIAANVIENVIIGFQARMRVGVGTTVIVGANNTMGGATAVPTTVVGAGNIFNNAFSGPGVGIGSTWNGAGAGFGNQQSIAVVNNWVAVGRAARVDATGGTALGDAARAAHTHAIALGRNAISLAANQFVVGAQNVAISSVLIGQGDTQAGGQSVQHRYTNGNGNNDPAGTVTHQAGLGTGSAATGGDFEFATGIVPAGAAATVQTPEVRFAIRPAATGGAAVEFLGTDGAGAAAGTLTNAPSAGDPAEWIPILFNGNVRFLPAWA